MGRAYSKYYHAYVLRGIVLLLLLCNTFFSEARFYRVIPPRGTPPKFSQAIRRGDAYFKKGIRYFKSALSEYKKAEGQVEDNLFKFRLGVCYMYTSEKFKGYEYVISAYSKDLKASDYKHLYLAKAYHLKGEYDEAIQYYKTYEEDRGRRLSERDRGSIQKFIRECERGKGFLSKKVDLPITPVLKISTKGRDLYPVVSPDGKSLYFSSYGDASEVENPQGDIVKVVRNKDQTWGQPIYLSSKVNSPDRTEHIVAISSDGYSLLIVVIPMEHYGRIGGKLFLVTKDPQSGEYSEATQAGFPAELRGLEDVVGACFSHDGQTIYFTSRTPKGNIGKYDVYYTTKQPSGEWGPIVHGGKSINSPYDEISISAHPAGGVLYITSDGHDNMGGFDIFRATVSEEGNFSNPQNLGYPISSPSEESFYSMTKDGRHGYLSRSRSDGRGGFDVYEASLLAGEPYMVGSDPQSEARAKVSVLIKDPTEAEWQAIPFQWDTAELRRLAEIPDTVIVHDDFGDDTVVIYLEEEAIDTQYLAAIPQVVQQPPVQQPPIQQIPVPQPPVQQPPIQQLPVQQPPVMGQAQLVEPPLLPMPMVDPPMEDRAEIMSPIEPKPSYRYEDASPQFYGSQDIIIMGGVFDGKGERVVGAEIVISSLSTKEIIERKEVTNDRDFFFRLDIGQDYLLSVKARGFLLETKRVDLEMPPTSKEIQVDFYLKPLQAGVNTVMENVLFFSYNTNRINVKSNIVLDRWAEYLRQNPQIILAVSGHTDNRGTLAYNIGLSRRRADEVVRQLTSRGISPNRFQVFGRAHLDPIGDNRTEEGRRTNRRVELRILSY